MPHTGKEKPHPSTATQGRHGRGSAETVQETETRALGIFGHPKKAEICRGGLGLGLYTRV